MEINLSKLFSTEKRTIETEEEKRYNLMGVGIGYGTYVGTADVDSAMRLSAVYRAIEVISDAVASLPFQPVRSLGDKNGTEIDKSHYSYDLLNTQPNKIQSRFTYIKKVVSETLLNGNSFTHIIRKSNGDPVELRLLTTGGQPNPNMFLIPDTFDVYYTHPSVKGRIRSEDMIHVIGMTYDGLKGVGVIEHAANATATASSADKQARNFFTNGSNLNGIVTVNGKLDEGQADEIKQQFKKSVTDDGGGVLVMEGSMDFKPISVSSADAQLLETRKFSVLEIARFFGVSPVKLFDTQATTYSNIENSQLAFLTDTISVWCEKIEAEFNRKLYRPSERKNLKVQFDIEQLLRADMITQADYMSKLFMIGGYTVNEIRKKVGTPVYEHENANIPYVQSSMLNVTKEPKPVDLTDNNNKSTNTFNTGNVDKKIT